MAAEARKKGRVADADGGDGAQGGGVGAGGGSGGAVGSGKGKGGRSGSNWSAVREKHSSSDADVDVELSELSLTDPAAPGAAEALAQRSNSSDELVGKNDDGAPVVPGNSGKLGAGFNFVNSIVGAGIIGLPLAVSDCGFFMGIFLLTLVAYFTYFSVRVMVDAGVKVNKRSYEGLSEHCFGWWGFSAVSFFMAAFALGGMFAYLVIIGDTVPVVLDQLFGVEASRNLIIFMTALVVILPLCLLRDMAALSWSSSLSMTADVVIVLLVLARASFGAENWPAEQEGAIVPSFSFAEPSIFAGLGGISFAYVCQHSSFIVFNTLKQPTTANWRTVNLGSVGTAFAISMVLGLAGYLAFFNQTRANVLNNFACDDTAINVARLLLAFTMVTTFPMEHFVARHSIYALFHGKSPPNNAMPLKWHFGITLTLWSIALLVGLTVTDLGKILQFTGAFSASVLGYIVPAMCHIKVNSFQLLWHKATRCWSRGHPYYCEDLASRMHHTADFFVPVTMILFGTVAMVVGSVSAVVNDTGGNDQLCITYP